MHSSKITLHSGSIWINNQPQILFVSSLFYFRIPAAEWQNRMRTIKTLGYNAIDVYFPWNYHESEPGQWDFCGDHNAQAFLQLAKEEGLWVIARPGPYICAEWDGGSLPAYLNVDPEMQLRENSVHFLDAVQGWYDRIMPLIAKYQIDNGGTVILVQIENELDFYDCSDRSGLMTALRDMALHYEINVPLIACAGQGDILGTTGGVEGIVPTCNFYFDSRDQGIEERVRHYDQLMRQQGYPLCVTETNRSHMDLRRLVLGGAKLIGPYLQTSGTNFGFTASVTNWGDPLSFITTHYDFGGMISPSGKVRPEGREAIVLTKIISTLGTAMALSVPMKSPPIRVQGIIGHALELDGGGWLIGLPNTGDEAIEVTLGDSYSRFPVHTELKIKPNTCPFVLVDLPLSHWGIEGRLQYSTSELVDCQEQNGGIELTFAVDTATELLVSLPNFSLEKVQGWKIEEVQKGWRFWVEGNCSAKAILVGSDGKRLVLNTIDRAEISDLKKSGLADRQIVKINADSKIAELSNMNWRTVVVDPCDAEWFNKAKVCKPDMLHLEENNIYRGFGWYRTTNTIGDDLKGFLVRSGSDVLTLHFDHKYLGTFVPGGGDQFVPLPKDMQFKREGEVVVRAEIWGHTNFDDHRLPALRLNSMRGMSGLAAVRKVENITPNWFYQQRVEVPSDKIDLDWPFLNFGGWVFTDVPLNGIYYHQVSFEEGMDTRVLSFPDVQVSAKVFLNGQAIGEVNPFNPYVDLSDASQPGETALIAVVVKQEFRRHTGQVFLYQGESLQDWNLTGWNESRLADLAEKKFVDGITTDFPVSLGAGEMAWLHTTLLLIEDWENGWNLQLTGTGIKVSAWIGRRLVGRVWLPSEMRPCMTGGADDRIVLPASWLKEAGGHVHLLLESVNPVGELLDLRLIPEI